MPNTLENFVMEQFDGFKKDLDFVGKQTFLDVAKEADKNVPVLTGALKDSITMTADGDISQGQGNYTKAIDNADMFPDMSLSWQIPYSMIVEFGNGTNRQPRAFARNALGQYDLFLQRNVRKVCQ